MEEFNIETISKRSVHGVVALISRQFFLNVLSYIASLVVFTVLSPKEVGIYVVVIAIQRIISFLTDFGLGAALIQKKDKVKQEDLTTIFTIQLFIGLGMFILLLIFKNLIASFFAFSDAGIRLLIVLVFTIFLSSFKVVPSLLLERSINFSKLVIPQMIESFVFNTVLILLLLQGKNLDSYSVAFLISSLSSIPFYYFISPWKIQLGIDRESLKHLKYGVQFQAKNILATIKDDLLIVIIAKILPLPQIGYIGFGQRNAFFVFRYVVDSVTKVTFSTYSRIQHDAAMLRKAIEKSLFFVSAVMFPLMSGLIIISSYFIQYFPKWHNKWEPALLSLIFFSLNAMVSSLSGILVNTLDSTGRVKTTLKLMTLWTTLTWFLTPLLIVIVGYNGVAIASFIITLTIFYTIYLVKKVVVFDFWKSIYKPLISSIMMSIFVYTSSSLLVNGLLSLIFVIILGGIFYSVCFYLLAQKELKNDIKFIFAKT